MNVQQEKISELHSKISIDLKKEDYEPKIKSAINKLGKQVSLKGFRPGMAPISLVKKMYGNSVLYEELNKILSQEVDDFIKKNKIAILAQPLPVKEQRVDWNINELKDINFTFEIGHAPQIDLSYLKTAPTFTKYKITIDDKMVDEEIDHLRKRFPVYEYPELLSEGDIAGLEYHELDEAGNEKEGGYHTYSTTLLEIVKPEFKQVFLNLKKEDTATINVLEVFDRDKEGVAKYVLNLKGAEEFDSLNLNPNFKIKLTNITRNILAELNEAFFEKTFGANGPKTEEDARAFIKADLEPYLDGRTDVLLINDLYRAIMENVNFSLPDEFLKRWIMSSNEKPITQEQLEADYPTFSKQLRWDIITGHIADEQKYEVTHEEVVEKIRQNISQQLISYGLTNLQHDMLQGFVDKQLQNKEQVRKTSSQIIEEKVFAYIKSKVKLEDKPISLEDFNELIQKENAAI